MSRYAALSWRRSGASLATLTAVTALGASSAAQPAPPDAGTGKASKVWASCAEHLPEGAVRPTVTSTFPERGLSGYEARLEVVVKHGPGETVLPEGFRIQRGSDAARAIEAAGFVLPHPDGGSPPRIDVKPLENESTTLLSLPFVPLPEQAGRHELILPPIPIAVARASGEVMTLCTEAQTITVDDPIANESDPEVRGNPPPRVQREPWDLAKQLFIAALVTLVLGALLAWLIVRWLRRPKPAPPRPTVLPWIAAMQQLDRIRQSGWLAEGRTDDYFDSVDDCIRFYLGERYGFDGLESTTEEVRDYLRRIVPAPPERERIERYLDNTDLIKFADLTPTKDDCSDAMERAERIVRTTTPPPRVGHDQTARRLDDGAAGEPQGAS